MLLCRLAQVCEECSSQVQRSSALDQFLSIYGFGHEVCGIVVHGFQIMAFKRVVSQRRLSTLRFNARQRTMPFGVPIKCSSVLLSRPSQMPSSHADSSLLTSAPGRLHGTASPTNKIGLWSDMRRIFSYAVVVQSCLLWNLVYCHAACRGNQVT